MAASPFCTPCSSPLSVDSSSVHASSSPSAPELPFSSTIPLHQPSGYKSFADVLCSGPSFEHISGHQSNAFCHPLPDSFAGYSAGCSQDLDSVSIKQPSVYNGMPCIFLTNEELDILDKPLELTLIAKFPAGRPKWVSLNRHFQDLKLIGGFKLNHYDSRHVVIHLKHPDDYINIFAKPVTTILGFAVKLLKWTRDFDIHQEPNITPVWISLPNLCMNFYTRNILLSIASAFGKPLLIDPATAKGSRPSNARILVELNVLKQHPKSIWLGNDEFGYKQEVEIENLPKYCEYCCKYGHLIEKCYLKHPHLKQNSYSGRDKLQYIVNPIDNHPVVSPANSSSPPGIAQVAENAAGCATNHGVIQHNSAAAESGNPIICNSSHSDAADSSLYSSRNLVELNTPNQVCNVNNQESGFLASTEAMLHIMKASSLPDKTLKCSAINKINWGNLNFADQADQIIDITTSKLIEECYQVVFEGSQLEGNHNSMQPVDSNASTFNPLADTVLRLQSTPISVLQSTPISIVQQQGLNVMECEMDVGVSSVAKNDQAWMGLAVDNCIVESGIKNASCNNNVNPSQSALRRHSWSNDGDHVLVEHHKPKRHKKKDKPQIQIEKNSGRNTRSCKKDAFYYLL